MAPGPRKKNFNRRNENNVQEKKVPRTDSATEAEEKDTSKDINDPNESINTIENKKYSKRTVTSNWNKYDEVAIDPHADVMRGKDFEVLLSYYGGSQSQMQMADEKEWDEVNVTDKSISLDLVDLVHVVKCIPFHKRINIPSDVFHDSQLAKFTSNAETYRASYSKVAKNAWMPPFEQKVSIKAESVNPGLNVIESYECEVVDETPKAFALEGKTESIIESLASCLSLKSLAPEKMNADMKVETNTSDDLDFLLSLSNSSKKMDNPVEIPNVQKQTNVDDWLNSILDD